MKTVKLVKTIALLVTAVIVTISVLLSGCTARNYYPCSSYASHPAYHDFR